MTKITMELVKELREKTQVGMMDCKTALTEADGDIEKAIELLRKKGAAVAIKRATKETNNGHIQDCVSPDSKVGVLVKISCETDFSANTKDMKDFAKKVCLTISKTNPTRVQDDANCLLEQDVEGENLKVKDLLNDILAKITENIKIEEFIRYQVRDNGLINSYIHPGANLGCLIELETDKVVDTTTPTQLDQLKQLSRDLCMQIAVTNPQSIASDELDPAFIAKEKEIIVEQLKTGGKPENMIEKICAGKLQKLYEEVCLIDQVFIKQAKTKIKDYIKEIETKTSLTIKVKRFARFQIGK